MVQETRVESLTPEMDPSCVSEAFLKVCSPQDNMRRTLICFLSPSFLSTFGSFTVQRYCDLPVRLEESGSYLLLEIVGPITITTCAFLHTVLESVHQLPITMAKNHLLRSS
jgi:hypothetical protein